MKRNFILLAATLVLVGAGCDTGSTNAPAPTSADNSNTNAPVSVATPEKTATTALTTTVTLDNTWRTYTSTGLGIAFKWPTTGTYAPTWETIFPKSDDGKLKDGCYGTGDTTTQVTVQSTNFCHTSMTAKDGTPTDYYATKIGDQSVVISFTKKVPADDKTFNLADYHTFLDQIVSTFVVTK